jgi:protein ImuB
MFVSVVCVLLPRFELVAAAGGRGELLAQPVALAPAPGGRPVIGQASAAAEAHAVRAGLPLGEAFARCPGLRLVTPDPQAAAAEWERAVRSLESIGAEVEAGRPGEAWFEGDSLRRLHGGASADLGAVITKARTALARPARIGVAQTRFVALLAAHEARPRRARMLAGDRERRAFLAGLPVARLALRPGMDELVATLEKLGIETLGQFAALGRAHVAERFGALGLEARDLLHGREPPLRPDPPAEQLREEIALHAEAGATQLHHALTLLVERLLARRQRAGRTLRSLTLGARFAEGGSWHAQTVLREPTADAQRIVLACAHRLPELPEPAVLLSLVADVFGPQAVRPAVLFGDDGSEERRRRLDHAARQARIAAGDPAAVARVMRLDEGSRLPERRAVLTPGPTPLARPRPLRPQLDEDGTPCAVPRAGPAARVAARTLARRRRTAAERERLIPVATERERWEVEDRWWTGRPVRRRYHELVLTDGTNVVLFQDLVSGRWYEQRA